MKKGNRRSKTARAAQLRDMQYLQTYAIEWSEKCISFGAANFCMTRKNLHSVWTVAQRI
ncbi:MAG TPA: hypothetical protein VIY49_13945 [Bryobacteraceae bacterium]